MKLLAIALGLALAPALHAASSPHPDFSGVWTWNREAGQTGRAESSWPRDPPLQKEAKDKVDAYKALVAPSGATPGGACVGYGMPSAMLSSGGYPMEMIQRPEQITVIYEAHTEIRRIYIDRKIDARDIIPSRDGTSFGRWEGDTLVVETIGLKEAVDQNSAHSEDAKIVERYRLGKDEKGRKILTAELTLTDPKFYTKPVTVTKKWLAAEQSTRMMPYDCTEPAWEDHLEKLRKEAAAK
jgi:hypothetical protein